MKKDYVSDGRFFGHDVSEYGKKSGFVDYWTLATAVGYMVRCNNADKIFNAFAADIENGDSRLMDDDAYIFQYYIITPMGADILKTYTDEIVFYV